FRVREGHEGLGGAEQAGPDRHPLGLAAAVVEEDLADLAELLTGLRDDGAAGEQPLDLVRADHGGSFGRCCTEARLLEPTRPSCECTWAHARGRAAPRPAPSAGDVTRAGGASGPEAVPQTGELCPELVRHAVAERVEELRGEVGLG